MDKELNQATLIRFKLRNKYLKSKSETDKQRIISRETNVLNYCAWKRRNITNRLTSVRYLITKPFERQYVLYFQIKVIWQTPE